MRIFPVAILLVHALVVSEMAHGAAVDRYDTTFVIKLQDTTRGREVEESSSNVATTAKQGYERQEEEYNDEYYYYDEEEGLSGDYELEYPKVLMSSKPKDPSSIPEAETAAANKRGKGKKKGKGKGKKRNPCLKKYKDFCIHGTCQYLRDLRAPSCVCHPDYSGERCEFITLPTQSRAGYSRTTALAVVAVVLSSICLTIIGLLLMLRFHKRGAYDVENEEKAKVGLTSNH